MEGPSQNHSDDSQRCTESKPWCKFKQILHKMPFSVFKESKLLELHVADLSDAFKETDTLTVNSPFILYHTSSNINFLLITLAVLVLNYQ